VNISFTILIALPLLASPLIYLTGRMPGKASRLPSWLSLAVLLACWVPFYAVAQQLKTASPLIFTLQEISLRFDGLSLLLAAVSLGLGTLVAAFSGPYLKGEAGEEKYFAMLTAMVGVMIALGCAGDLFNLWVWFEAMAVTSYLLVVFYREEPASLEAGIKYVVQSATGSVLILLGIALVLSQAGTTDIATLTGGVTSPASQPFLLAAGALFLIGFGVKSALVPLHTWLPDAHTQAPSGISAMLSGVVIEAGLIAMLRSLGALSGGQGSAGIPISTWGPLLMAFGALNMLVGNLMALRQTQVKRLLAFSSLAHMGYMLTGIGIAMSAGEAAGAQGGLFHLLNHALMKGLAFLAVGALMYAVSHAAISAAPGHPALTIHDLDGAARRYPLVALTLSLAVLGLGGLPPLAGFMSKWQIFVAGFQAHHLWISLLIVFAALNSVLSLAYYAPLVNAVYRKKPSLAVLKAGRLPGRMTAPLLLLALAVTALGLWPNLASWLTGPAGKALLSAFGG
jgi:proton-translocating NADH-quinone oxidoreductase chain N